MIVVLVCVSFAYLSTLAYFAFNLELLEKGKTFKGGTENKSAFITSFSVLRNGLCIWPSLVYVVPHLYT